jgi:hypothetical protein
VKSHAAATQETIGAVARMPKMIPNFSRSMMMSIAGPVLRSRLETAYTRVPAPAAPAGIGE